MLELRNDRLHVEIATPGTVYRGSRFDWSTFITQVTLDGQHTFCVPESLEKGEGSGGIGLCNEFGIFQPIGYKGTRPDESFPKLGVGLLRRLDEHGYSFATAYPIEPFPLKVREEGKSITFEFEPLPCRGYEARLKKTMRVTDNRLRIEYELENVGTQKIVTHEYCHNFLSLDGAPPSPDYSLRLAGGLHLEHRPVILTQEKDLVEWKSPTVHPIFCRTRDHLNYEVNDAIWELWHRKLGVMVSESVDYPISRFALWSAPHVVSPEVFVDIAIEAGETMKWNREFRFDAGV